MKSGTIYCEFSGAVREAMRAAGWDMWSCDLLPPDGDSTHHIQGDAISAALERSTTDAFAGVHWPCTWFTNAGVKWMYLGGHSRNGPDPERARAMRLSAFSLGKLLNILLDAGVPFYFENPVMHGFAFEAIVRYCEWFSIAEMCTVQPWNFGVWETKRTCLWLNKLPPPYSEIPDDGRVPDRARPTRVHNGKRRQGEEQAGRQSSLDVAGAESRARAEPHAAEFGASDGDAMGRPR